MTVDEFLSWESGDHSGQLWQLVDGVPLAMVPGSENHGATQGEFGGLICEHLRKTCPRVSISQSPWRRFTRRRRRGLRRAPEHDRVRFVL